MKEISSVCPYRGMFGTEFFSEEFIELKIRQEKSPNENLDAKRDKSSHVITLLNIICFI